MLSDVIAKQAIRSLVWFSNGMSFVLESLVIGFSNGMSILSRSGVYLGRFKRVQTDNLGRCM